MLGIALLTAQPMIPLKFRSNSAQVPLKGDCQSVYKMTQAMLYAFIVLFGLLPPLMVGDTRRCW